MPLGMRLSAQQKGALSRGKQTEAAIREIKRIEPDMYKELTKEFRKEARAIGEELRSQHVPQRGSPLSGMAPKTLDRRQSNRKYVDRYRYHKPGVKIVVGSRDGGRRKTRPIVAIRFQARKNAPGYQILELAGTVNPQGKTYRGRNLIQGLKTAGYPLGDGGRFVIPPFYAKKNEVTRMAERIVLRYSERVSAKLAAKVRKQQGVVS